MQLLKNLKLNDMFTQPAFIRKNTPEIQKKLQEIGYKPTRIIFDDNKNLCIATAVCSDYSKYTNITNEMFDDTNPNRTWNCAGRVDCGTNEELFLAIAALRDDTDKNQWFVMDVEVYENIPKDCWFKATDIDGGKHIGTQIDPLYCHKATVEELIEHFKN